MYQTHEDDAREVAREQQDATSVTPRLAALRRRLMRAGREASGSQAAAIDSVLDDLDLDLGFREISEETERQILAALGLVGGVR